MEFLKLDIQLFAVSAEASKSLKADNGNTATIYVKFTEQTLTDANIVNNTTTIKLEGTYTQNTGSWAQISSPKFYLEWYDDKRATWTEVDYKNKTSMNRYEVLSLSGTIDVPHKDDGTLNGKARVRWTYTASSTLVPRSGDATTDSKALTQVPRKNTISSTNAYIEECPTITIKKQASSSTTKITYICSGNGQLDEGLVVESTSLEKYTSWAIPTSIYKCIPSSGKAANITLTAETFVSGKSVGTDTTTFLATISKERSKPDVSSFSIVDINEMTRNLTGNENVVVLNASTMRCTYSAIAKNGAYIKSANINNVPLTINASNISGTKDFAKPTTNTFTFSATDSKEFPNSNPKTLNKIDYFIPTLNATIERNTPTDGKVNISFNGKFYNGSFGTKSNEIVVHYRYAEKGKSLPEWTYSPPQKSGNTYSSNGVIQLDGFDYQKSYTVQVQMSDSLNTIRKSQDISVGRPNPWWDKENMYVDGHYYKRDGEVLRINSTHLDCIPIPTGASLTESTYLIPGIYYGNDASNYSNCPVTNGSFTLEVTKTADGIIRQLFHKHRENTGDMNWFSYASFERCYTTNWTPWSCTSGFINAYNSSGSPGWYRVLTLGSTSPYVNTGGVLNISSSGSKPGDIVGTIMFSYYNNTEYSFKILNGNINLSDIKAVKKSDNSIDICIRTNHNYEILMVGIDTLTSYTAFDVSPSYLGNSLPAGTQISFSDVSGWTNMSFVNGWYNHSNDYSLGQYKKVGNQVFLRGFIRGGTNDLVTTLPEGYRPARSFYDVYVKDNNVFGTVIVDKSGRVSLWGYASNSWNSFNLSFFID